ncbi:MAG: hypothetical protein M0R05_04740, partial [Bacilli bacterium]|nr:hypothetical protein [Bacilli bacterium]
FISSKDVYDVLVLLNKRTNTYFTPNYLAGIGIGMDRANEIVEGLIKFGFLIENSVEIDDQDKKIYIYINTPALIILFTALDLIVKRQNYWCYCTEDDKQYFN